MRTTSYSVWEERDLRTTLWIRSNLEGFRFTKANRRVLNRVQKQYRICHHDIRLDTEHEALYAAYIVAVGGDRPATLVDFLGGEDAIPCFDTQEISIWDGDELVAFCYYDAGSDSLMSLLGVYAPLHAKNSLGFATLLLEMELAMELGMRFHYSGYVLPGEPRMDYKLRAGAIEYLDPDDRDWHPWSEFDPARLPDRRMRDRLDAVGRHLGARGVRCRIMLNPLFELAHSSTLDEQMVDQPMMLLVGDTPPLHLVTWDDPQRDYVIELGAPAYLRHRRGPDGPEHTTPTAIVRASIARCTTVDEVAELLVP